MNKNCISEKFKSIFMVSTFAMLIEYIVLLSDNIIVGHMLGEKALSAITLVMPIFSITIFLSFLVSVGTTVLMAYAVGNGEREEANRLFGQGVILAVSSGVLLSIVFMVFQDEFLQMLSVSKELYEYCAGFYSGLMWLPAFQTLNALIFTAIIGEGGEKICTYSSAVQVVSNIGLSIFLCYKIGIIGASIGSVISNIIALAVLMVFFLSKDRQLRVKWYFNLKSVLSMIKYSLSDAMIYLYLFILQSCLNLYLLREFGDDSIVVFSVVINMLSMMIAGFDGIGEALQPLVCVYHSEDNLRGKRKIMKTAVRVALGEGIGVMVLMIIGARWVPKLIGITNPEYITKAAEALRIFSFSAIFLSLAGLYACYYIYIRKIPLSLTIMGSVFLLPIPICILLGELMGLNGVWLGIAVSPVLTLLLGYILVRKKVGKEYVPLFINSEEELKQLTYDIRATKEDVMELVYKVEADLEERGVDRRTKNKIELTIEECGIMIAEKNKGKSIYIECNLFFDEKIKLILRDNGAYNDISDADAVDITSLQSYAAVMLVASQKNRSFVLTGGLNRHIFEFEK